LEGFDNNNPEMGIDSVARQMHQKTVQQQHYWVNIVKQQVTGGGVSHTYSANRGGFESSHVSVTGTGTVRQSN